MPFPYRNILVLYKKDQEAPRELALQICDWLATEGIFTRLAESRWDYSIDNTDCAIVLGGDGTILGAARRLAGTGIPILGINFGKVGFLTTAARQNWRESITRSLRGQIPVRKCLSLRWGLYREKALVASGVAGNDLVLSRESLARLVSAHVWINHELLGVMRSDGIIISTPLGSSGYNLSAGGPLLYVGLNVMALTPICPFLTGVSPLVFPAQTRFELCIDNASAECSITIDGQEGWRLEKGDIIRVSGWENSLLFITNDVLFFSRMRLRGFVLEQD